MSSPRSSEPTRTRSSIPRSPSASRSARSAAWTGKAYALRPRYRSRSPARRERREQARDVARLDATVVRAMRERNDVPCEAVAADVGRLPHVAGRPSPAERVVQRPALAGAAAFALAVRAHDDKRVSDGPQRRAVAGERARQVDAVEVVLVLDLEPEKTLPAGLRPTPGTRS